MTGDDARLKAIAALVGLRGGVGADYVSELLGEVTPDRFTVPVEADAAEIGLSVLQQVSGPVNSLINGFILAFEVLADAYEEMDPGTSTEEVLQELALRIASEPD
ncbi:hypothetical protein ACFZBM_39300 [Streptomyces lavendulae]|uniref:Uncharacterized protein n=1 Tax=Streptomyces lavendulae subsp. lavendulae TaxID=58340 RepID=A0A2K8PUN5_STRLA|nr:hypothetical protein [Streptomyces lavendulae]ATZ29375.1 hypothetical protein SLAV_38055 [Streptomyces lavendulae subsp. lavendulae]QUQ59185.1 hypothetical protein SLLC_36195 [Streptomyces lavendulae subsp. lavendulae]